MTDLTIAVWNVHGARWDPTRGTREQEQWDRHAAFMDELCADGRIVLAGPMADGSGSLVVVRAASVAAARAMFDDDPWAAADILHVDTAKEWTIFLDGRRQ